MIDALIMDKVENYWRCVAGSTDPNMVPAYKALEIFVEKMIELKDDADAFIVTGYPRNIRDVVEYIARVHSFTVSEIHFRINRLKSLD